LSLSLAGVAATAWMQLASAVGAVAGGLLADRSARKRAGGRMSVQVIGLLAGAPFILITGWTLDVRTLAWALVGFGFFKGMYDANIWASLYDVVDARRRATAQGLMNAIGLSGAGIALPAIAAASEQYGMSTCLNATSLIYIVVGTLLVLGMAVFMCSARAPRPNPSA
jgi:MFS family permease